ncbi:MAG: T9SS type A sorting domain-containing protein [Flavobacteriales bacterium]|nr:T9SS type A sorting domain-containing protein [Flavobacteriales bacterium]
MKKRYTSVMRSLSAFLPGALVFFSMPLQAQTTGAARMLALPPGVNDMFVGTVGGGGVAHGGAASNATCAGAVINDLPVGTPVTVTGDNTGAVHDPVFGVPVVWEAFTTTECADVAVGYCGTTPSFAGSLIMLGVGCPLTNVVFNSPGNILVDVCGDGNYTILFRDLPAGTYYFPVLQGTGSTGPYTLTFMAAACTSTAPANAMCAGAIELPSITECTPVLGDVAFATAAGNTGTGCGNGDVADGIWYYFEAQGPAYDLTVAPSAQFSVQIEVFAGGCDALSNIACAMGGDFGVPAVAHLSGLTAGATYHVRVSDRFAGSPVTTSFFICMEAVTTIVCEESAGTITADVPEVCLTNGRATITGIPGGDAVVPEGYQTLFYLSTGAEPVIVQGALTPSFEVTSAASYTIHTLVFNDATLDLNGLVFGTTTVASINTLLVQAGGGICASLDLVGAAVLVRECLPCPANTGALQANASNACLTDGSATIDATVGDGRVVPDGFEVLYLLTSGQDLIIRQGALTPAFVVHAEDLYTIHTLVYDPATLDLGDVAFGVTSVLDMHAQLMQGGGDICAALDVVGAPVNVHVCTGIAERNTGTWSIWPSPNSGRFSIASAEAEGSATVQVIAPDGRLVHEQRVVMQRDAVVSVELPDGTAAGVYTVRFLAGTGVAAMRMVLE